MVLELISNKTHFSGSCSPNLSRTERNLRALQCLDNNGDVAFINVRAISTGVLTRQLTYWEIANFFQLNNSWSLSLYFPGSSNIQINSSIDQTKYRVLCSNGTIANGVLDVDENCALGTGVQGEVKLHIIAINFKYFNFRRVFRFA